MSESLIKNVSDTAFMVAVFRATENRRARPLFRDPLPTGLAGEHGIRIVDSSRARPSSAAGPSSSAPASSTPSSTRRSGGDRHHSQSRRGPRYTSVPPHPRLLRWIEVDYPHVIELKNSRLADDKPTCQLTRVADLADDKRRQEFLQVTAAGSSRILVLTEGVIPYLESEAVATLARELRSYSSFIGWITDYFSPLTYKYRRRRKGLAQAMKNAPFKFEPLDYFGFFAQLGWNPREVSYLPEEGARLGRPFPLPLPIKIWLTLIAPFMSSEKRTAMRHLMGYVLFTPTSPAPAPTESALRPATASPA